jgi:predicted glycosyltransferase
MSKNILFDIGHPAHVHLFRNFIFYLKNNGYSPIVASRDKDLTITLLDYYNIDHIIISKVKKGLFGLAKELIIRDKAIFKLNKIFNFLYSFGTSVSIGHLSLLKGVLSYNFNEDDDDVVPLYSKISYPFSSKIICPDCLKYSKWEKKRVFHNSYHELAYLHPNNFSPDNQILKKYDLKERQYIIFRFSALNAHHDINAKGITKNLYTEIKEIASDYEIIESVENSKNHKIDPWDLHHVMAFAKMIISDSQTMTAEAAVLGVPSLRINTFVGRISYLEELEHKYGLTFGFLPNKRNELLKKLEFLINYNQDEENWKNKKNAMLLEKCDLNMWMINYFEMMALGNT